MNTPTLAAALLMGVTFLVHVFVGGPEIYSPLRQSALSEMEISVLSVVWHFVSVQLFLTALMLGYLTRHENRALFVATFLSMVSFAILFIAYGLVDLRSLWVTPQWIAFALTAALMCWGWRRT